MGLSQHVQAGQTPLEEEERDGLKILTINCLSELDEFEQKNIEEAIAWTMGKTYTIQKLISTSFIRTLHKKMYGHVWNWGGQFRKSEKNIGIPAWQVPTALKMLLDDVLFWIDHKTYPEDEIAIRFKHRLVSIHCFSNGNGRHSRLMADLISEKIFHQPVFTWGRSSSNLQDKEQIRKQYLRALKMADKGKYSELIDFSRS
jgi:Fic-DOC domain mobile mystery protein B